MAQPHGACTVTAPWLAETRWKVVLAGVLVADLKIPS